MAVKEVTSETEFDKGFDSANAPVSKEVIATEKATVVIPAEEKPVEVVDEANKDTVEEKKSEVKVEDTQKSEVSKPDTSKSTKVIDLEDNSPTFKQRWKSQEGVIKSNNNKISELEAEIAKLKTEQKPVEVVDVVSDEIDKLESKYMDAFVEDDKTVAIKIRKQIDDLRFKQFTEITKQTARDEASSTVMNSEMEDRKNEVVFDAITKYPFLDHTNDKVKNQRAINRVRTIREENQKIYGMGFIEALEAAVAEVAPQFDIKAKIPVEVVDEPVVDEEKVQSTVVVKTNSAPVKLGGKPKGPQTFDEGFDSVKPFG